MRISATGTDRMTGLRSGFTLLELLVVLVIVGLMSAAVVLTLPAGTDRLRAAAEGLARDVREAQARAITSGNMTGLVLTTRGYQVVRRARQGWVPMAAIPAADWPQGATVTVLRNGGAVALPEAVAQNTTANIAVNTAGNAVPLVFFSSVGEGSDFSIAFAQDGALVRMAASAGRVRVETGEGP